jgi:HPt (histidine-containing phosphotransfer) domain-containing protein
LVRQVARLFLSECPRHLARLRGALAAADAAALQAAIHTLKGSVGNLSAGPAFAAARRLEGLAHAGRLAAAAAALADLERELDRLRPALRALVVKPSDFVKPARNAQ